MAWKPSAWPMASPPGARSGKRTLGRACRILRGKSLIERGTPLRLCVPDVSVVTSTVLTDPGESRHEWTRRGPLCM